MRTKRFVECSPAFRARWFSHISSPLWEACAPTNVQGSLCERILAEHVRSLLADNGVPMALRKKKRPKLFTGTGYTKKLMRLKVYEMAARLVGPLEAWNENYRVLMLAGGEPEHEARVARACFLGAEVLAFDLDARAVQAAVPHVDLAVQMDVGDLRARGSNKSPSCLVTPYHFANMDFCGLTTSDGVGLALDRAAQFSQYVASWHAYGHEQSLPHMQKCAAWVGQHSGELLAAVPGTIRTRLLYLWDRIRRSNPSPASSNTLHPIAVWTYVDQRMPMMCVLWSARTYFDQLEQIPFEKVVTTELGFKQLVLDAAELKGSAWAADRYGLRTEVVAAWRAVATKQSRARVISSGHRGQEADP